MTKTIINLSISLDGFVAGRNISEQLPMGENGELLHKWFFEESTDEDRKMLSEFVASVGAVIVGGRTYDIAIDGPWNKKSPFAAPALVMKSKRPAEEIEGFIYVSGDPANILAKAKSVAAEKNVWIMGGANIAQQFLHANLVDELHIHIAPVLLGDGTPLFISHKQDQPRMEKIKAFDTRAATHVFYRVTR